MGTNYSQQVRQEVSVSAGPRALQAVQRMRQDGLDGLCIGEDLSEQVQQVSHMGIYSSYIWLQPYRNSCVFACLASSSDTALLRGTGETSGSAALSSPSARHRLRMLPAMSWGGGADIHL